MRWWGTRAPRSRRRAAPHGQAARGAADVPRAREAAAARAGAAPRGRAAAPGRAGLHGPGCAQAPARGGGGAAGKATRARRPPCPAGGRERWAARRDCGAPGRASGGGTRGRPGQRATCCRRRGKRSIIQHYRFLPCSVLWNCLSTLPEVMLSFIAVQQCGGSLQNLFWCRLCCVRQEEFCQYNSFLYWRAPLPAIDLSDIQNLDEETPSGAKTATRTDTAETEMET